METRSKYSNVEFLRDSSIFVPRYGIRRSIASREGTRSEAINPASFSTRASFETKRMERPRESATTGCDFSTNDIQRGARAITVHELTMRLVSKWWLIDA